MTGKEGLLWDSCIFYTILKGENYDYSELNLLNEQVSEFNSGKLVIFASTILLVEVRQSKLNSEQMNEFNRMLDRSNLYMADVTPAIALRAANLRNELKIENGKHLSTPDAIQVATAIEFGVEMWTLDEMGNSNAAGILNFADEINSKYNISVCRPHGQLKLEM